MYSIEKSTAGVVKIGHRVIHSVGAVLEALESENNGKKGFRGRQGHVARARADHVSRWGLWALLTE